MNEISQEQFKKSEKIVRSFGENIRHARQSELAFDLKDSRDMVTSLEKELEPLILEEFHKIFPEASVYVEDTKSLIIDSELEIYIDIIDGTKYFVPDVPLYSVSVGINYKKKETAGFVYHISSDMLYSGMVGFGAFVNGNKLETQNIKKLSESIICVDTMPSSAKEVMKWRTDSLASLFSSAYRVRLLGQGSLGLCWTAQGAFDAFIDLGETYSNKPTDLIGGIAICKATGCLMTQKAINSQTVSVICSQPNISEAIFDLLKTV